MLIKMIVVIPHLNILIKSYLETSTHLYAFHNTRKKSQKQIQHSHIKTAETGR